MPRFRGKTSALAKGLQRLSTRPRPFFLAAVLAAAAIPTTAVGAPSPPRPDKVSAADAYRESLPTSGGPQIIGSAAGTKPGRLPRAARRALARHGGTDAPFLERLATSPALGAPPPTRPAPVVVRPDPALPKAGLSSAAAAVADVGRTVPWLALLMIAIVGGAVGARVLRARM